MRLDLRSNFDTNTDYYHNHCMKPHSAFDIIAITICYSMLYIDKPYFIGIELHIGNR